VPSDGCATERNATEQDDTSGCALHRPKSTRRTTTGVLAAIDCLYASGSTQSLARSTARFQPWYSFSRSASCMLGTNSLSIAHFCCAPWPKTNYALSAVNWRSLSAA